MNEKSNKVSFLPFCNNNIKGTYYYSKALFYSILFSSLIKLRFSSTYVQSSYFGYKLCCNRYTPSLCLCLCRNLLSLFRIFSSPQSFLPKNSNLCDTRRERERDRPLLDYYSFVNLLLLLNNLFSFCVCLFVFLNEMPVKLEMRGDNKQKP